MVRTSQNTSKKGVKAKKVINLLDHRDKKHIIYAVGHRVLTQDKKSAARYSPVVKKLGKRNIVITPLSEINPIVFEASPRIAGTISPNKKRIAKWLKKMPFADIRRIGYDILDE